MELNIHPPLPRRKEFRIGVIGSGFIVNDCHLPRIARRIQSGRHRLAHARTRRTSRATPRHRLGLWHTGATPRRSAHRCARHRRAADGPACAHQSRMRAQASQRHSRRNRSGWITPKPSKRSKLARKPASFSRWTRTCATTRRFARPMPFSKMARSASPCSPRSICAASRTGWIGTRTLAGWPFASCRSIISMHSGIGSAIRKASIAASAPIRAPSFRTRTAFAQPSWNTRTASVALASTTPGPVPRKRAVLPTSASNGASKAPTARPSATSAGAKNRTRRRPPSATPPRATKNFMSRAGPRVGSRMPSSARWLNCWLLWKQERNRRSVGATI